MSDPHIPRIQESGDCGECFIPYYDTRTPIGETTDSFGPDELMAQERFTDAERNLAHKAARHCIRRRQWRGGGHGHRYPGRAADEVVSEAVEDVRRQVVILQAALMIANAADGARLWDRKRAHTMERVT